MSEIKSEKILSSESAPLSAGASAASSGEELKPSREDLPMARTIDEAMDLVGTLPVPDPEIHTFPLGRVVGRVLAQDFRAPFAVPGFTRSRLDGFAVRAEDLAHASARHPVELVCTGTVAAGQWPAPAVTGGTCVRIMAGAPLPEGATAVVGFEDALPHPGEAALLEGVDTPLDSGVAWKAFRGNGPVRFTAPVREGAAVGRADIGAARDELLVGRGVRLAPAHVGRLASAGLLNVPVFSRPRVAVLSTGSELLLAGMPPAPGKIYNSGQAAICGVLEREGAIPLPCGIARDDAEAIAQTMTLALRDHTMLVTTGGVGRGDFDCILDAMALAGADVLLAGGQFRPGGNFALASLNGKYILSLSGAPGSALVMLHLVGIPLVRRLTFDLDWPAKEVEVVLAEAPARTPRGLVAGSLELSGGAALFHPLPLMELERRPLDLVVPLDEGDDITALVAERRPVRAWLCR